MASKFFTAKELAAYLQMSETTLRRLRAAGEGPPLAHGARAAGHRKLIFSRADVMRWLKSKRVVPKT